ncbi:RUN and FYVE domain-containing protein 4 isoform X3 [Rousettus aegyptiacus]|uniref:RUN and FYVE domain-containing protein 4 isoform X3 n=1 Tax=Rousettus aegyptiacus TaxID=9407 RepID=UPI00168CC08A|nr:RUN and FYVE domain-containing protein 4 isoform X3 [Rousettus aegyptiacus]
MPKPARPVQALILPLCVKRIRQLNQRLLPGLAGLPEPQGITSFSVLMAEEGIALKVTSDLKAAVSAIVQGYRGGQSVTDASAELHRLCGCLELLLQFDQKEQKSFLGPRKDYWDFLCSALWRQRGNTEAARFVLSQDKLKTPLGKGRAFIRFCLAHGQLAESLQLCLLNPELTREWYGPWSPLVRPKLREDILDSLYTLNGVAFDLDLQRPDLDGAWPMFSESCCSNSSRTRGRRPRKSKVSSKEKKEDPRSLRAPQSMWEPEGEELQQDQEMGALRMGTCRENSTPDAQGQEEGAEGVLKGEIATESEGRGILLRAGGQGTTAGTQEGGAEWGHVQRLLVSGPGGVTEDAMSGGERGWEVPSILGEPRVLRILGTREASTTEKPQEETGVTSVTRGEEQAEVALQGVVKSLRHKLQKTKEQVQHQEQLLKEQEGELKELQEQLSRCQEERGRLQAELQKKRQEAERRDAMYDEELGEQRDLVRAMKSRVLELIREKDNLWQKVQHLSSVAPGCCVGCSKLFGRLSRRYQCRVCGGLVCHACSVDYKKRERCCPPCAQKEAAQAV